MSQSIDVLPSTCSGEDMDAIREHAGIPHSGCVFRSSSKTVSRKMRKRIPSLYKHRVRESQRLYIVITRYALMVHNQSFFRSLRCSVMMLETLLSERIRDVLYLMGLIFEPLSAGTQKPLRRGKSSPRPRAFRASSPMLIPAYSVLSLYSEL